MTDYKEEQDNELEALEAIYPDEFKLLSEPDDRFHKFSIYVQSADYSPGEDEDEEEAEEDEDEEEEEPQIDPTNGCCFTLQFQYTPTYPDDKPDVEVLNPKNLLQDELVLLNTFMDEQFAENAGMAMVFTVVAAAQEWASTLVEERRVRLEEEERRRKEEEEERERKVFEGTRVTLDTFMTWKAKFDEEMAALKKTKAVIDETKRKLTGRQLFMSDKTLNDSDLSFLKEGEGSVAVDESLFEDLDDLDLDEDSDEDPDYVP